MVTIKHGEDLLWYDFLKYKDGRAANLTGITASAQMRIVPEGELVAEGVCTIDAEHGTLTTLFTSAQTENLKPGEYGFDVWLDANGQAVCIDTVQLMITGRYTEMGG